MTQSGCSVSVHGGHLRLRFRWKGRRYSRSTEFVDTAEDRRKVERLATLIAATIKAGRNPLTVLGESEPSWDSPTKTPTVAQYFQTWIERKKPLVRKAQARDYQRHIEGYVLPRLGPIQLVHRR